MFGVNPGESLKCYYCHTGGKTGTEKCREPKESNLALTECNSTLPVVSDPHIYCRIMVQSVEGEKRIVRGCATGGNPGRCVQRTGTNDIQVEYCECEGDGCNAASSVMASVLTFFACTLLALFVAS